MQSGHLFLEFLWHYFPQKTTHSLSTVWRQTRALILSLTCMQRRNCTWCANWRFASFTLPRLMATCTIWFCTCVCQQANTCIFFFNKNQSCRAPREWHTQAWLWHWRGARHDWHFDPPHLPVSLNSKSSRTTLNGIDTHTAQNFSSAEKIFALFIKKYHGSRHKDKPVMSEEYNGVVSLIAFFYKYVCLLYWRYRPHFGTTYIRLKLRQAYEMVM